MNGKKFGYVVGQILAAVLFSCAAICLAAIMIGLTIKFVGWIF